MSQVITWESPIRAILTLVLHTLVPHPHIMIFYKVREFVVTGLDTPDVLTEME